MQCNLTLAVGVAAFLAILACNRLCYNKVNLLAPQYLHLVLGSGLHATLRYKALFTSRCYNLKCNVLFCNALGRVEVEMLLHMKCNVVLRDCHHLSGHCYEM